MSDRKLLARLLRLTGMKVTGYKFTDYDKQVDVWVKPYKNGCRCPECERRCPIVSQGRDERNWNDISVLGRRVVLWYRPKKIRCPTHGRAQEQIPWAAHHARVTYRTQWRICARGQLMTQKAAAEILCMPTSTVSDILHRVITRVRSGHRIRGLVSLGVDEIAYKKGHKYLTLVYDLDLAKVVWVGEGKGRETIDRFFNEVLSEDQKKRILWASSPART